MERTAGFVVVGEAHTAAEAREMAAGLRPELVLMDVYLPDGNGLEVVRTLLEQAAAPGRDRHICRQGIECRTRCDATRRDALPGQTVRIPGARRTTVGLSAAAPPHRSRCDVAPKQADVDEMFRLLRTPEVKTARPSKGHSAPTLELVREAVRANEVDISAAEISEQVGISRATAQRYLNYLERHGVVTLQLRYGTTGRPEHRYHIH